MPTCSDLLTHEPLKLLNIVIRTDIHKDTHIRFQWITGMRLKQLKNTHTHTRIADLYSLPVTNSQQDIGRVPLCSLPLRLGNVPVSMGSQWVKTTAMGQEQRSPRRARLPGRVLFLLQHRVTALWTLSISVPPGGLDLPVLSTLELPSLCQPGFPQSLGNTGY